MRRVRMPEQANAQVSGTGDHLRSRKTGLSAGLRYMAGSTCRPTTTMSWAGSAGWRCRGRTVVAAVRSVELDVRERGQAAGDIRVGKLLARNAAMGKVVDHGLRGHGDVVPKAARLDIRDGSRRVRDRVAGCPRWPRHEGLRAAASAARRRERRRGGGSRGWSRRLQQPTSTPHRCPARPEPTRGASQSRVGR